MDGTLSADSTIQEHRDRGDTYNGQFYTSNPLVDGLLGLEAYGSASRSVRKTVSRSPLPRRAVKRRA